VAGQPAGSAHCGRPPSWICEKNFNGAVKRPILHKRTKFRKYRSKRCGDIAIFVIFKMAAAAILDFQKFKILTVDPVPGAITLCVILLNFIKIGRTVADKW